MTQILLHCISHLADLFEETVALGNKPKEVSNWIMGETMRLCKEEGN